MEGVDEAVQDGLVVIRVVMTEHDEQDTDPFGDVYVLDSFWHNFLSNLMSGGCLISDKKPGRFC